MSNNPYFNPATGSEFSELPRRRFSLLKILLLCCLGFFVILLLLPFSRSARPAARRMACSNNLKQIGLALHNYHDTYGAFPPAFTVDVEGKPLHSWRTLILAFMEQEFLYDQIDLQKPWYDPVNEPALRSAIGTFTCPEFRESVNLTCYQAIVGSETAIRPGNGVAMESMAAGLRNILVIVEVPKSRAVPWMQPIDISIDDMAKAWTGEGFLHANGAHGLRADGSVVFLSENIEIERMIELANVNRHVSDQEF
jgi:hypothetical protein